MRGLRTVAAAFLIVLGASLIALWAVSGVVVRAVEDGTVVHGIAQRALDDDAVSARIARAVADGALEALADAGVDLERLGLDGAVRGLLEDEASTDDFHAAVLAQIDGARAQFEAEVTAEDRASAPLLIDVDVSDYVNGRIDDVPVVGERAPDVVVAPIPVRVMSADAFDTVRTGYRYAQLAQSWGLVAGIACIVVGLVVTHRTRWFVAKAGLAVGVIAGGLWLLLQWWGVEGFARALPGGADGSAGAALLEIVTDETMAVLEARLGVVALVGLAVCALALAFALLTRRRDA
ncbi:hypothetical protein [Demequina iriomotensis]|uniref:hypothetical protein n=1 Tax=Demequina iriomotensis TaxID=1536641 RepID=UPI0007836C55|nr:hypothetical protein [Demequina iriomotensis]